MTNRSILSTATVVATAIAVLAFFAGPLVQRLLRILPSSRQQQQQQPSSSPPPLRIGLIGASNIAKFAVLWPASRHSDVAVHAVAARSSEKAKAYAKQNGIPVVHGTYQNLIEDPNVDAVYVGVISELHFSLARLALEHGKHVLLEKPAVFSANQARTLSALSQSVNRAVLEAFHWRYHPAAMRVKDLLENGNAAGELQEIHLTASLFDPKHTWFVKEHGEKQRIKLFDRWCYLVDELHFYLGTQWIIQVDHVTMEPSHMYANLTATRDKNNEEQQVVHISMDACKDKVEMPSWGITLKGSKGTLQYDNALFPFVYHRIVKPNGQVEQHYGFAGSKVGKTSYEYQLDEFVQVIRQVDQAAVNENQEALALMMIRNGQLSEAIVAASKQEPLHSLSYPPLTGSL